MGLCPHFQLGSVHVLAVGWRPWSRGPSIVQRWVPEAALLRPSVPGTPGGSCKASHGAVRVFTSRQPSGQATRSGHDTALGWKQYREWCSRPIRSPRDPAWKSSFLPRKLTPGRVVWGLSLSVSQFPAWRGPAPLPTRVCSALLGTSRCRRLRWAGRGGGFCGQSQLPWRLFCGCAAPAAPGALGARVRRLGGRT